MATPLAENRASWRLSRVAELTGGELVGQDVDVLGVCTDSRRVRAGNLFVALEGERFDAHRFLTEIWAARASALVRRGTPVPEGASAVQVDDTLVALGELGADHRRRWAGRVVGITGSAGKTTTKDLVAAALEGAGFAVTKTRGNLNNRIGVPMTLFDLDASAEVAVVEMGTSEPGEIARLATIAQPDVGVLTLIDLAHTAGLGSLEAVAEEKGALLAALPVEGVAIVQGDDALTRAAAERSPALRRVRYGRAGDCDVRVVGVELEADLRTRCTLAVGGHTLTGSLELLGEAAALNAAGAIAVVWALAPERVEAAWSALEAMKPSEGRMRPLAGPSGVIVLDDAYNANPRSMSVALATASEAARRRGSRFVAVLGDMRELGDHSPAEHDAIVRRAVALGVDRLVVVGDAMTAAARGAGVRATEASPEAAAESVLELVEAGDVVLVKASRSLGLERVVRALTDEPDFAGDDGSAA